MPQLHITRPQRIATFFSGLLAAMAVNAIFFGKGVYSSRRRWRLSP
jgi:hypothetical protein